MFSMDWAGINCFDLTTKHGAYAGLIIGKKDHWRVYFDGNATKGSAKKFATAHDAMEYLVQRRLKKGWTIQ